MGHDINFISCDEKCDRRAVLEHIRNEAATSGDGYYGSVKWHDEVEPLRDYDAAMNWIIDEDNGWYDDHAVRYYEYHDTSSNKKIKELSAKIKELVRQSEEYQEAHSVRNFKAALISCNKCGSKVARKYIRGDTCPVCGADLRSKSTLEKIAWYKEKRMALSERLSEERYKIATKEVKWLVKYEYHS